MFAGDPAKHPPAAKKTILVFSAAALTAFSAAAPPMDRLPEPADSQTRPGGDTEIIVKPPAGVDSRMAKPAPRNEDPELVERPPADATPGGSKSRAAPPERSRRNDCKGAAEDCKQSPAH